jgi:hypothetical protein
MIESLTTVAQNIHVVAEASNIDTSVIIGRDIARVQSATLLYQNWVLGAKQRAETKIRRLRDYKFGG